ncbi:MAG TPA: V-type ATP synthase subunit D [Candidatus Brocadiia bacterium]|nr:V-type ATP synthase subunit D [Candidatus Brocadiia bacterium]
MPKLNIPPTKSNFLQITRDLDVATEGFDLLEQKRQILVLELMRYVSQAKTVQQDVDTKVAKAFEALRTAVVNEGVMNLNREAAAVPVQQELSVSTRQLMGIALPVVEAKLQRESMPFSFGQNTAASDEVIRQFTDLLEAVTKLAEVENAVFRLARELKKTQRRVNALEKLFIPDYKETLSYILDTLEEREREGFVIMRMVKERRDAR